MLKGSDALFAREGAGRNAGGEGGLAGSAGAASAFDIGLKNCEKFVWAEAASEMPGDEKPLARGGTASEAGSEILATGLEGVGAPFTKMRVNSPCP
jgi:hypothetical protein